MMNSSMMDSPLKRYSQPKTVHFSTNNPSENQLSWIQDLVVTEQQQQQPHTPIKQPLIKNYNPTTTPSTPNNNNTKNSPLPTPSTPKNNNNSLNLSTPLKSTRVPISLNPNLAHTGLILGQKSILDRIRINLLSLIIVWIITSTQIYNQLVLSIVNKFPFLSVPFQLTEWLLLVILLGNLVEGYYRYKTQTPVTHVELPLTPQQIRGGVQHLHHSSTKKHPLSASLGHHSTETFNRSGGSLPRNQLLSSSLRSSLRSSPNSPSPRLAHLPPAPLYNQHQQQQQVNKDEILTLDPTVNPLSRNTLHLFKRSFKPADLLHSSSSPSSSHSASHSSLPDHRQFLRHSVLGTSSSSFSPSPSTAFNHSSPLFARSGSVRKVSNQLSLQKLLDENLFPSTSS
ncbi:hypothetical protein PGT21_007265 [Puccinia graminis f. sp. tritici]|uniref:Uncharacterized protein n=1 Tax=Puccinia graminis f. sp. tritici TaxID=56615 RepID=A0A5B0QXK5_PUCGR|nr:hypothetical protein PGT21_007265 [Puccinia graminis f. sp. tritici]